ncbi:phosphomannomutase/phosphoglucomutase [Candidatus Falkowbacteria bacterium CG10_big_fil_rev_8_21_14_0_10_39_11]|uniref:Phosphomannomutase/phosphoglucomutase n=1 Tax=Candidatus Falkowbacteria bacterium CG10_big_fil_rev_8_21_14_0_10_39_11 TaxID=1974565 RepID=A0A2H0V821_9BACT|nr:MAG: phosphomannomutase/phosphoglucomutase [Candidatus Falkowbacteria bacterium CG10_big_fil_rev_8_21_14_0_10_39_11]
MKNVNSSIFKAYDIRGIYEQDIDADLAFRIGQAFAVFMKTDAQKEDLNLAVARDMRLSSQILYDKVVAGIVSQGVNVTKLGMISTPTFYYGVGKLALDGGIQVSASHNPAEYNGFKLVREKAIPVSGETGIMDIRDLVIANQFQTSPNAGIVSEYQNLIDEHVDFALEHVDLDKIKSLKIVVDVANAMGGPMFEKLFAKLPCELLRLNFELDGTFPSHEADPLKDENNAQLHKKVLAMQADMGIALDGDADRIFFVTNEGVTVEPAIIRGILSQIFLRENPGAKICYDVRPGKITPDMIEEAGGVPIVTKVGHSLIKEKAREVGAVFAGESSGHFFAKLPFGFFEVPMICALKVIQELSESGKTFSDFVKPLYRYSHSGERNFEVDDKGAVFEKLRNRYGGNLQYDFDGLSFTWDDWWFNVRPSNTENKVRLNLEAVNDELMNEKVKEVSDLITS